MQEQMNFGDADMSGKTFCPCGTETVLGNLFCAKCSRPLRQQGESLSARLKANAAPAVGVVPPAKRRRHKPYRKPA